MSSLTARYNADVIATECRICHAKPPNRCLTVGGYAHGARIKDAGWKWCGRHRTLESLHDPTSCDTAGQAGKGRKPGSRNKKTTTNHHPPRRDA